MTVRRFQMLMVKSCVLTALLFAGGAAHAAVILDVDVSDPMAVVFTTTTAFAQTTVQMADSRDGFVLASFFSGNTGSLSDTLDSGAFNVFDSAAGTTRQPMDGIYVDTFQNLTLDDLNIFETDNGGFDMYFLDTGTALTGSASHDLSALNGFPTLGTVGPVFAGSGGISTIGQWRIVPEPSTAALTALGLVGLVARRRRN
jgi:hypothetical protein